MSKRAIILAGGKGTRLKPFTIAIPKPLVPVGDYTILEIIIRQLAFYGFTHVTIALNHHAELIQAFFQNGDKWKIKIDYSREQTPLSTMGPLKLIPDLPENFLVMNGDILTDMDYSQFFDFHAGGNHLFTIAACSRELKSEYGVLNIEGQNLVGFEEKPVLKYNVSMGIYCASHSVLDYIPQGQPYGFDHLMLNLIGKKLPANIYRFNGYWLDIGRPDDYAQAIDEFHLKQGMYLK